MDVKIKDKDTEIGANGDPVYIDGIKEILQRVKIACTIKKGSFPFDRQLGSYAHTLNLDDDLLIQKLEMIYKEATIDIPYSKLEVVSVDKNALTPTALVRVTCLNQSGETEVTINV